LVIIKAYQQCRLFLSSSSRKQTRNKQKSHRYP
jgi:hypothetical protein